MGAVNGEPAIDGFLRVSRIMIAVEVCIRPSDVSIASLSAGQEEGIYLPVSKGSGLSWPRDIGNQALGNSAGYGTKPMGHDPRGVTVVKRFAFVLRALFTRYLTLVTRATLS